MLFERFEDSGLSQFSYAVACPAAGAVAIVDPRRDVDVYVESADLDRLTHGLTPNDDGYASSRSAREP